MLKGKRILVGITGGIAAYKIPFLVRLLIKEGAQVKVMMTPEACNFVTPLTLSVLSQNPVAIEPFNQDDGMWHSHIELGSWADIILLAPLTANTMAKMASGISDNLLLAVYLAARCPVFIAPSMDMDMYYHTSTQQNIKTLQSRGSYLISPNAGELASGLVGMGRLEEPENIIQILKSHFSKAESLKGKKILITSGPTLESIDPVRFISNHSSGKMGNALALEAANRGAEVILISGPVNELPLHPQIKILKITSTAEMYERCIENFSQADITIMAAAVADFTPGKPATEKIKKGAENLVLNLNRTKDILAELGKRKKLSQILVGFALETQNAEEFAKNKLEAKNLDFIVLNTLQDTGAGFGSETNKVSILSKNNITHFTLKSKSEVATDIFDAIL